jgi:hypothetical protein
MVPFYQLLVALGSPALCLYGLIWAFTNGHPVVGGFLTLAFILTLHHVTPSEKKP